MAKGKTKRWRVHGTVVASTYLGEVEAETKEEAEQKAHGRAHVSVCHQCAEHISDPEVESVEAVEVESNGKPW